MSLLNSIPFHTIYETNGNYTYQGLEFDQWDASGMSYRRTYSDINGIPNGVKEAGETDPTGTGMGLNGEAYIEANQPPERDFPLRLK